MILDNPNCFDGYKLFWSGPNHFVQVQIRLFWTNLYNLDPTKTNWTRLKRMIWTVQNHFGPIEGQGIKIN